MKKVLRCRKTGTEVEMRCMTKKVRQHLNPASVSFDDFFYESNEPVASAASRIHTPDEPPRRLPGSRSVSFDSILTIFYYKPNEPVFPINNPFSRVHTPDEPLPRLHRGRRFGSYNNWRAHLYIPDLSTV